MANESGSALKGAESVFLALLTIGLIGLLFLIIYGNISDNLGWVDTSTNVVNESITIDPGTGISTITSATNVNFVSWNATLILNATICANGATSNETLVEGTDYTLFTNNGTFINLTGSPDAENWNATFVTYTVVRESQGETNTDAVIGNLTGGATEFFTFANVWFILTAITILIGIVLGVISLVRKASGGPSGGKSGRSEFTT